MSLFDRCEEDGLLSLCLGHVLPEEWSDSEDQVDVYNLIERYVVTISSLIDKPHNLIERYVLTISLIDKSHHLIERYVPVLTISSLIDKPHGM